MPRLQVLAGPSPDSLLPITANSNKPHPIKSDIFEGQVVVHIEGFPDAEGNVLDSEYFSRPERKGVTWSIQVQGRFLHPVSADDVLFGNTFDRPLKLPWGSSAALRFMHFVDPTLEHDLTSHTRPWALSPLISTMPNFAHVRLPSAHAPLPPFPPHAPQCITDDTSQLFVGASKPPLPRTSSTSTPNSTSSTSSNSPRNGTPGTSGTATPTLTPYNPRSATKRRAYFSSTKHRAQVTYTPADVITTDFCYGFLAFSPALALNLPGGISFDLMKYWDGQPVRFVCLQRPPASGSSTRNGHGNGSSSRCAADGRPYWCVAIVLVSEGDEDEEDEDVEDHAADAGTSPSKSHAKGPTKTKKRKQDLHLNLHRGDSIPEGLDEEQLSARILSEAEAERLRFGGIDDDVD